MYRFLFAFLFLSLLVSCTTGFQKRNILVFGDSNGEREGWVFHLQKIRGGGPLVNTSLSGNTYGFNYDGQRDRNTLENLTTYLRKGYAEMGGIDEVLIALGTNDCKARFRDNHDEIARNMMALIDRTRAFFTDRGQDVPRFVLLTPPPMDDGRLEEFAGGESCIAALSAAIRTYAAEQNICLVDLQREPGQAILEHSNDGIHFNATGYAQWAKAIVAECY